MTGNSKPTADSRIPPGTAGSGEPRVAASSEIKCRRFRVTGRVQGVFFRDSTREQARKLRLTGYANNMPDGSVEVVACGGKDALDRLGQWLKSGPPMASVAGLEMADVDDVGFRKFTIG